MTGMPNMPLRTKYGFKKTGESNFVVIAPHAAGDDLKTGFIARRLARKLNGFYVINNKFFKPTNSKASKYPEYVEDFNRLSWGYKRHRFLWKKKKKPMKFFYKRIAAYCDQAKNFSQENKATAIYIHGMNDDSIGIDIGVGLKLIRSKQKFIGSSKSHYRCSGVPTIKISQVKKMANLLQSKLANSHQLKITIGHHYPAWSKRIATQFHKHGGRNDYAIQLELSKKLRMDKKSRIYICKLISKVLKQIFI